MNQYFNDKLIIGFGSLMKKPALLFLKFSELFGDQFICQIIRENASKRIKELFKNDFQ